MQTVSFDVGGVLDAEPFFFPIMEGLVRLRNRVIIVTAIGHGKPEQWGYTEETRYATSAARLYKMGCIQGQHWHDLYVVPDPDSGPITGRYKNFIIQRENVLFHTDDNERVLAEIKCTTFRYRKDMSRDDVLGAFAWAGKVLS